MKAYIINYTCKCRSEKFGMDELRLLEHYADVFGKGSSYCFVMFSLAGFTSELLEYAENNRIKLITMANMY